MIVGTEAFFFMDVFVHPDTINIHKKNLFTDLSSDCCNHLLWQTSSVGKWYLNVSEIGQVTVDNMTVYSLFLSGVQQEGQVVSLREKAVLLSFRQVDSSLRDS